jgi:hypothetical protein
VLNLCVIATDSPSIVFKVRVRVRVLDRVSFRTHYTFILR